MQIDSMTQNALAQTMERVDPYLALVDGDGTIHDRRLSRSTTLPAMTSCRRTIRALARMVVMPAGAARRDDGRSRR